MFQAAHKFNLNKVVYVFGIVNLQGYTNVCHQLVFLEGWNHICHLTISPFREEYLDSSYSFFVPNTRTLARVSTKVTVEPEI